MATKSKKPVKRSKKVSKPRKIYSRLKFSWLLLFVAAVVLALGGVYWLRMSRAEFSPNENEKMAWDEINAFRTANGKGALKKADCLSWAAREWSKKMAIEGSFRHGFAHFVSDLCPGRFGTGGENIGVGPSGLGATAIVTSWKTSEEGHRATLLAFNSPWAGVGMYDHLGELYATFLIYRDCESDCNKAVTTPPTPVPVAVSPSNGAVLTPCVNGVRRTSVQLSGRTTVPGNRLVQSRINFKEKNVGSWSDGSWTTMLSSNTQFTRDATVTVDNQTTKAYEWIINGKTDGKGYTGTSSIYNFTVAHDMPPSQAGNFRVSNRTSNSVTLAWDAATDDCRLVKYELYRNPIVAGGTGGAQAAGPTVTLASNLSPTTTSFTDNTLNTLGHYSYQICALDNYSTPQKTCVSTGYTHHPL